MATSSTSIENPRIVRKNRPEFRVKRTRTKTVLPYLLKDFDQRCAYSLRHIARCGALEVDHFDPGKKKDLIQEYDNLFPATGTCNKKKGARGPTAKEAREGDRFLNPCKEMDYGGQIFENPNTFELVGTTRAARWHIRVLGLNAPDLLRERGSRARNWKILEDKSVVLCAGDGADATELIAAYRGMVSEMIPKIPAPPLQASDQEQSSPSPVPH
ncbi:MAG: HNH endonuclease [Limisphaerales bacterium]